MNTLSHLHSVKNLERALSASNITKDQKNMVGKSNVIEQDVQYIPCCKKKLACVMFTNICAYIFLKYFKGFFKTFKNMHQNVKND